MSLRTRALPDRIPEPVRRWALRALFRATVDAFGAPMPDLRGCSADAILSAYATCTDVLAGSLLLDPERRPLVERCLRSNMERLGRRVRVALGVRTTADALDVAHRLYGLIGIDLTGDDRGQVVVTRCSFATRYSPDVCRVMSASDAGLLAGLTDGGRLTFSERITTGSPVCLATLSIGGEGSR
ncbi:MAG TPA: hypothetical protein VFI59_06665 [Actinomycetota bacterium]|nr:hypothetical protein [Actinomycetota bacterium]